MRYPPDDRSTWSATCSTLAEMHCLRMLGVFLTLLSRMTRTIVQRKDDLDPDEVAQTLRPLERVRMVPYHAVYISYKNYCGAMNEVRRGPLPAVGNARNQRRSSQTNLDCLLPSSEFFASANPLGVTDVNHHSNLAVLNRSIIGSEGYKSAIFGNLSPPMRICHETHSYQRLAQSRTRRSHGTYRTRKEL